MILDGKAVANSLLEDLKTQINEGVNNGKRPPRLVIISVGDDPASKVYVRNKIKAAKDVGIEVDHVIYGEDEQQRVIDYIDMLNYADRIDGIMVQLPLPKGWDEREIIDAIDPAKDVDGLTTANIGRLRSGQDCLKPCTAQGVVDLLEYYDIPICQQKVTILGRSNIVGKPLADLLMQKGATVTQCHTQTKETALKTACQYCDILISAVGKVKLINHEYVRLGQTLVDVGINRTSDNKLCGDIDFEDVKDYTYAITPVPGGVGPMTVAELMKNVVLCWVK